MKKALCLFLCLVTVMSVFVSCKRGGDTTEPTDEITVASTVPTQAETVTREIKIGYFKGKSLNPYKTQSPLNRNLLTLVYDSLFVIDDDYTALPLIADSFTNEGNKLTVRIADEMYFSDGSLITPADVVYSFRLAKEDSFYKERLGNINTAVQGEESVIFTLKRSDIYAESSLIFPIIKHGTGTENYPTGSGRYIFKKSGGELYLKANTNSTRKEEMSTDTIRLIPISADAGELYLLQTGDLTCFFDDLSDSNFTKINANMVRVPLNNLVYLAFNSDSTALSDPAVKTAVEYCIDKNTIADTAYDNFCRTADGIFNPDWSEMFSDEPSESSYNTVKAEETLENADYIYAYSHNKYRSKDFNFLRLKFIVNSENTARVQAAELIAKEMRSVGMEVTLYKLSFEEYSEAIANGDFDMYLGEVSLSPNMDLSVFFGTDGALRYGIDTSSTVAEAYFDFAAGTIDYSTFRQVFSLEKPFIPICYRDGIACFSRELSYEGTINQYDLFKNAYSWEITE